MSTLALAELPFSRRLGLAFTGIAGFCQGKPEEEVWDMSRPIQRRSEKTGKWIGPYQDGTYPDYAYYHPTGELFIFHNCFQARILAVFLAVVTPVYTLGVMAVRAILVPVCLLSGEDVQSRLLGIITSPFYGTCLFVTFVAGIFFGMHVKPITSFIQQAWLQANYRDEIRYHEERAQKNGDPEAHCFQFISLSTVFFLAYCFVARGNFLDDKIEVNGKQERRFRDPQEPQQVFLFNSDMQ